MAKLVAINGLHVMDMALLFPGEFQLSQYIFLQ